MKKFLKNAIVFFIALIMFVLLSNTTKAVEVTDAKKSKILEFLEANNILSYYNYDKVENIYITNELLHEIGGNPVTEEQRKNAEIYEMVNDMKEGFVITRDSINNYLQNTIGLTVDKLKNYDQFLNQTTTSDNKNQFYYFTITSPADYSDYAITKVEETSASTIKVTITAKMNKEEFSNVIELVKKGDSYNFVSSTSADGKSRPLTVGSDYQFNDKKSNTSDTNKILEFIKANKVLSYYNYDKVENIYITRALLCEVGGSPVSEEQRKNTGIYEMIGDLKEGFVTTKDAVNQYLQNTLGITVDKLKNYEQFLNQTTTSDNKNQFYYFTITGPTNYSDYAITKVEETSASTIKVTITAKMNEEEFSNVIELVKKGDSYNFVSSTSADGKNRSLVVGSENEFNNKTTKTINPTDKTDKDNITADTKIPQTGITKNIIIISILSVLGIIIIISLVKYNKSKND